MSLVKIKSAWDQRSVDRFMQANVDPVGRACSGAAEACLTGSPRYRYAEHANRFAMLSTGRLLYVSKLMLLSGLISLSLLGERAMSYEEPQYTVVQTDGEFEYRQYEPYRVSETVIEGARNADAASSEGFRRLFAYISGANSSQSKISMTVPVSQGASEKIAMTVPVQQSAAEEGWRVSFMLPSEFTLETAPVPTDPRVYVREVPGRLMVVQKFSGRWTESNYGKHEQELTQYVAAAGLTTAGAVERAAYNAPFSIPWFRRNEVMVEIESLPAK